MLKQQQVTQITVESVFISRFTMNNVAPKLQKCYTNKIAFKIISEMLKQPNFFYSQPSTLPKDAPLKLYLSMIFGISSVAPTRIVDFLRIFNHQNQEAYDYAGVSYRN